MKPINKGAKMAVKFPKVLEIPISVPAKFGAKSKWFVKKPKNAPLFKPKAVINKNIAPVIVVSK